MLQMPLLRGAEQVKTARRERPMQLRAGPTAPRALSSRLARADLQMPPPAVRVAQPELLADRVAEGLELLRVDLQLPVLGLPVLGLPVLGLPVLGLPHP